MSQLWVTLNKPPRKTDVENYMNSDRNVVWQELLKRHHQNSQQFTLSKCNPDIKGEKEKIHA